MFCPALAAPASLQANPRWRPRRGFGNASPPPEPHTLPAARSGPARRRPSACRYATARVARASFRESFQRHRPFPHLGVPGERAIVSSSAMPPSKESLDCNPPTGPGSQGRPAPRNFPIASVSSAARESTATLIGKEGLVPAPVRRACKAQNLRSPSTRARQAHSEQCATRPRTLSMKHAVAVSDRDHPRKYAGSLVSSSGRMSSNPRSASQWSPAQQPGALRALPAALALVGAEPYAESPTQQHNSIQETDASWRQTGHPPSESRPPHTAWGLPNLN